MSESNQIDWRELAADLVLSDPFDHEYGHCLWCDKRKDHDADCAWIKACAALGYVLDEGARLVLEKRADGLWWPVVSD